MHFELLIRPTETLLLAFAPLYGLLAIAIECFFNAYAFIVTTLDILLLLHLTPAPHLI